MKKIRHNVFETNSSSCHSVTIASSTLDFILDTIYPDNNGKIIIKGGRFGWEFAKYNDTYTKLQYAATATLSGLDKNLLISVIKDQTGAEEVILDVNNDDCYIDHESCYILNKYDYEKLKNFLFNKNSWLFTANDNNTAELGFYTDIPIYTENGIEEVKYKYEFFIPKINKRIKLKDKLDDSSFDTICESLEIRYNKTFNTFQLDSDYWSSKEVYYTTKYWFNQDYKNNYIALINEKECDKILYSSDPDKIDKILDFINSNLDNPDVVYKLKFEIHEL